MKRFNYVKAKSVSEASAIIKKENALLMAGGTDLLGSLKDKILAVYPDTVVGLKDIEGLDYIEEERGKLKIGAMTTLSHLASSPLVKKKCPSLAVAAYSVATPNLRNSATLGGNVCQDTRCWYYRYPDSIGGKIHCFRKDGDICHALMGENRYHSIFGAMECGITPCSRECPANTDIPGYMAKLRQGDWDGAAKIIMRVNPMPMITSRICPHVCENKCNQRQQGESVSIHSLERTLGDYILKNADTFYMKPEKETGKKVGIIGAGPGGLTCAYYMRKQGHNVTVIDAHEKAGGVLQYGIPRYRLPRDIVDSFVKALEGMGVKFEMNTTVGEKVSMEEIRKRFDSIYFGTGLWKQPILGIQGEELTQFGLDFLVEVNTYLKKAGKFGNNVLVCGGGNVAIDVALTAVRLGAKNVTLACLEQDNEMPAQAEEIARAKEEGIKIYNGRGLKRVITDAKGTVTGLETMKCTSVFDAERRFNPQYDMSDLMIIDSDCIILATGQKADVSFLGEKFFSQIKSQQGLIDVEDFETYKTKLPNIYAGGDVVTGPDIAIRAIRAGRVAANSMSRELGFPIGAYVNEGGFLHFDTESIVKPEAAKLKELPIEKRTLKDEDTESLGQDEAINESKRCMNCGCLAVNSSDTAAMLIALGATATTNVRVISVEDLLCSNAKLSNTLLPGEIVMSFEVPCTGENTTAQYSKYRLRRSIDFAIIGLATSYTVKGGNITDAKIVLGSCAPIPIRATKAEEYLIGKAPCGETAQKAAELVLGGALPLKNNDYKIGVVNVLVKRSIENLF